MDIEILEKLVSKRNQVYKVMLHENTNSRLAILKKYSCDNLESLNIEYENMQMLKQSDIVIPEIIYKSKDSLIMEYIQGELVVDLVERLDIGNWIDELALWIAKLHGVLEGDSKLLKLDVNLRNFIYSNDKIYGLDFEEIDYGDARIDLGNICFFILTDKPSFKKEKNIMLRQFLKSYEKYSEKRLRDMDRYLLLAKTEAKKRRDRSR